MSFKWQALCLGLTFVIYAWLIPHFLLYSSPPTGDQASYLMVTISLAKDHDLDLSNEYAHRDEDAFYSQAPHPAGFVGMSAPYPLPPDNAFSRARPKTEMYDYHLPGLPAIMVPAWIVGGFFSLWWPATIIAMCVIGALVALNVFLLAYAQTGRMWIAWAVWLPLAFSNPLMSYSYLIFSELPTGLLVIYAFRRIAMGWSANGILRLLLTGLCIAYIPWLAWRGIILVPPLVLYALVQYWRHAHATSNGDRAPLQGSITSDRRAVSGELRSLLPLLVPIVISASLLVAYNHYLFGSILPPSQVPELGGASPFHWPWQGGKAFTAFVTNGFALLFDRQMGLLTYAPIYVLGAVGMVVMLSSTRTSDRRLLAWMAVTSLPYIAALMSFVYWNGIWNPPARYLTTLVPLLAIPLARSLDTLWTNWLYPAVYTLLAVPGVFLVSAMMRDPRMMWPANPVYAWLANAPQSPIHVDVRGMLPAFSPLNELTLPQDTALVLLVCLALVLGCSILALRQLGKDGELLPSTATLRASWVGVAAILGVSWYVMNVDYVQHKTELVQQWRWHLSAALDQPYGITYVDGQIYVAAYASRRVGALTLASGAYQVIVPASPEGLLTYDHPGDVKVGPDGLLYVLNNGEASNAMYVMRPDGVLVKRVALNHKTPIAIGLSFGPDGGLYVSDMVGGRILKYSPSGGEPVSAWEGGMRGFNNIKGLAVDSNGTVYVAESSANRIQQFDSKGHFVRSYDLNCSPSYVAVDGEWVDVSCGEGVVSIQGQQGLLQRSRIVGGAPPLVAPTGLTYGPDHTLFVLDRNELIAYRVQR